MTRYGPRLSSAPLARCAASGARESFSSQQLHRIGGTCARLAYEVPPRILITGSLYLAGHVLGLNGTPPG
jgi:hypothetical protein